MKRNIFSSTSIQVAVSDWDGTLRRGYTTADWIQFLVKKRVVTSKYAKEFEHLLVLYKKDLVTYRQLVGDAGSIYAHAVKGLEKKDLDILADRFVSQDQDNLYPFSIKLIKLFRLKGIPLIIVSGAPKEPLDAYGRIFGFKMTFALEAEVSDLGFMTGAVKANFGLIERKKQVVNKITKMGHRIAYAFGDSLFDLPLLQSGESSFLLLGKDDEISTLRNINIVNEGNIFGSVKSAMKH